VAGCAIAIALARAGVPTTVIEQGGRSRWRAGETLPPSARPVLESLGVWQAFRRDGHLPSYGNDSAWGEPTVRSRDFIFDPYGPGWHLDRARFDQTLASAAREAGVSWRSGTTVRGGAERVASGWQLELDTAGRRSTVTVDFVVDASGRAARFGRDRGARRVVGDRTVAVAGLLGPASGTQPPSSDVQMTTLVESVEGGWWYSAPVPDGRVVAVYSTDADEAQVRRARTSGGWAALLDQTVHTKERLRTADVALLAPPRVQAAGSARLHPVVGDGWLAVGDAAASHDPLSSQGILTALASAPSAADAVVAALGGDAEAPRRYAAAVQASYTRYLIQRCGYYRLERRWPASAFWQRRWHLPSPPADQTVHELLSPQGGRP
jgi:flavin-dependent dehydrogenase